MPEKNLFSATYTDIIDIKMDIVHQMEIFDFKGVPMLESGSALEGETLTIRFATLENPEVFGRKYPAAHLEEIMANLPFSDSRRNRVKFRQRGLS